MRHQLAAAPQRAEADQREHARDRTARVARGEIVRREPIGLAQDARPRGGMSERSARHRLDERVPFRAGLVDSLELHAIPVEGSRIAGRSATGSAGSEAVTRLCRCITYPDGVASRGEVSLLNAFSIDLEEYFQVANFDHCIDRRRWPELPSRAEAQTHRLLDLCDRTCDPRDVLRARLGRRAAARPVARDRGARPRDRLPRLRPRAGLRDRTRALPRGRETRARRDRGRGGRAGRGLPRPELLDHQALAVGARDPRRAGLPLRLVDLPGPPPPLRDAGLPARARPPGASLGQHDRRVPAHDAGLGAAALAAGRRRVSAPAAVRAAALGHRAPRGGGASDRPLRAQLGDRRGPAAPAGVRARALEPLSQPRARRGPASDAARARALCGRCAT